MPENIAVRDFRYPVGALNHLVALSDAQSFIALARDPAMRRIGVFIHGPDIAAYRFARPLVGYLTWAVSLGRPSWAPYALALVNCVACAATIVLAAKLIDRSGGSRSMLAIALLVTPSYLAAIDFLGADFVALALALGGLFAWFANPSRRWWGVALFALAGLAHERYLIVPLALLLWELCRRDREPWARSAPLVLVPIPYCVWIIVVHERVGSWPWDAGDQILGAPFRGLANAIQYWSVLEVAAVAILVGLAAGAFVLGRRTVFVWIVGSFAVFSAFFGVLIWKDWAAFSRVFLPLVAAAVVAIARADRSPGEGHTEA